MSHEWLIRFVEHRIGDPRMIRLIRKWLKAGVMDGAEWTSSDIGSPQGRWCLRCSRTSTFITPSTCGPTSGDATTPTGNVVLVRYADDTVAGFEYETDAKLFQLICTNGWRSSRCR
jgi:RNA-directed DNA polymerase